MSCAHFFGSLFDQNWKFFGEGVGETQQSEVPPTNLQPARKGHIYMVLEHNCLLRHWRCKGLEFRVWGV